MPPNPTGSLKIAIDALVALEQTVNVALPAGTSELVVYRWRPQAMPDLPAMWNWLVESPADKRDNAHMRDRLDLRAQIGVAHSAVDEQMAQIETYGDAFRAAVVPELERNCTLDGAVDRAIYRSMNTALDRFAQTDLLCLEFRLELHLIKPLY